MHSEFTRRLKGWFSWLRNILLALLLIAVGSWLPLMPAIQRFQEDHPLITQVLTCVTVVMTALGTLLLAFTQFLVRVPSSRSANGGQTVKTKGIVKGPERFFSGIMVSSGFSDEVRMWRVRKAFKEGNWWRVPRWRRLILMMLGAVLLFYGLFGLLILLFPPGVKFLLLLAVVYGTVRSVYAFAIDQPFQNNDDESR